MQAYRVKQALLVEIEGHKANYFAQFLVYLQHIPNANDGSLSHLLYNKETGWFKAAAFAPSTTINVCWNMQRFVVLDACYTKSKYLMMLMIAVGIDANNNAIPLA
jgi:hypothetical protein